MAEVMLSENIIFFTRLHYYFHTAVSDIDALSCRYLFYQPMAIVSLGVYAPVPGICVEHLSQKSD